MQAPSNPHSPVTAVNSESAGEKTDEKAASSSSPVSTSDPSGKDSGIVRESVAASTSSNTTAVNPDDPLDFGRRRKDDVTKAQMKKEHPSGNKRKLRKYYTRQNELIDQFLGAGDEERLAVAEEVKMGPKIRFAVNASFAVNCCLFVIQMYAAVSTGSLSLFATAADAFMDLVSSFVMFTTSRMAARPSIYKYPVVRPRMTPSPGFPSSLPHELTPLPPGPDKN